MFFYNKYFCMIFCFVVLTSLFCVMYVEENEKFDDGETLPSFESIVDEEDDCWWIRLL